jgi:hapalindole-type alkaloid chlorinase
MAELTQAVTPSMEVRRFDVGEADRCGDLIGDMFTRRCAGAIVEHVFSASMMAELTARIRRGVAGLPQATASTFRGGLFGVPLVLSGEDLNDYLAAAEHFRAAIEPLFASEGGLEACLRDTLARVAGGRSVEVARAEDGRAYLPASIRVLVAGDSLPIHYENGTTKYDSMRPLLARIDRTTIMSFYLTVELAEEGGTLQYFSTDCSGDGDRIIGDLGGPEKARAILAARGYIDVFPGVGDLLVFDGGRHYHLVTEVHRGTRWTLGGFFALTKEHDRVLYWS